MIIYSHFNSCAVRINEKFIWKKKRKKEKRKTTTKKVHMPTYTSLGPTILLSFFISLVCWGG